MKFHLPWKREQEKKEYTLIYDGNGGRQNGERFVRRSFWLPDGGFGKEKKFVSNTDGGDLTVETVFSNSNLKCIGYYARKRTEEGGYGMERIITGTIPFMTARFASS